MSEIQHPAIDPDLQEINQLPLADEFAQAAYETLSKYSYTCVETVGDAQQIQSFTDYVEINNEDRTIASALRLKRALTSAYFSSVELVSSGTNFGDHFKAPDDYSDDYVVMVLQYGTLEIEDTEEIDDDDDDDEAAEISESDYNWQNYALVVTDTASLCSEVFDGDTGEQFTDFDIIKALSTLNLLRKELLNTDYERALFEGDSAIEARIERIALGTTHATFNQAKALSTNYEHHYCMPDCTLTTHQQSMLN